MGFANQKTYAPEGSGAVGAEILPEDSYGNSINGFSDNFMKDEETGGVGYIGPVIQAVSDISSGLTQQKAANAAGNTMYANEGATRLQARQALITGLENQRRAVSNMNRMAGSARAVRGASGITGADSGGAGELTLIEKMRMEINDIGYQAQSKSKRLNYQADLYNWQGRATKKAGRFDILGTTLGIAGGIAGGVYRGTAGAGMGYHGGKAIGSGIRVI